MTHGYSWLSAAKVATDRKLPLHLICHDDWATSVPVCLFLRAWAERVFGKYYRAAASCLCVSPFMVEEYERRYGVRGTVLYPSRASDCLEFQSPPERVQKNRRQFTCAFAGSINSAGYVNALKAIANGLNAENGRLLIFGPLKPENAQLNGLNQPNIELHGLVKSDELIRRFREEADVLFVPMSFDTADKPNMQMGFPSKLTDYTAVGIPLLVYGPEYCSAVRWARENPVVAETVVAEKPGELSAAVQRLGASGQYRASLGATALKIGRRCFDHSVVQTQFHGALTQS